MTSATTLGRLACGRIHDMLMMQAKLQWCTNLCQTMHHPHLLQFSGALPHSTLSPQLLHILPTMLLHDKSEQIKHNFAWYTDTCCILIIVYTCCMVDTCCILITQACCLRAHCFHGPTGSAHGLNSVSLSCIFTHSSESSQSAHTHTHTACTHASTRQTRMAGSACVTELHKPCSVLP